MYQILPDETKSYLLEQLADLMSDDDGEFCLNLAMHAHDILAFLIEYNFSARELEEFQDAVDEAQELAAAEPLGGVN